MSDDYDYLAWMTDADWTGTPDPVGEGQQYSEEIRAELQEDTRQFCIESEKHGRLNSYHRVDQSWQRHDRLQQRTWLDRLLNRPVEYIEAEVEDID